MVGGCLSDYVIAGNLEMERAPPGGNRGLTAASGRCWRCGKAGGEGEEAQRDR